MLLMFEHGIRGQITQAVHQYSKANSEYISEISNPSSRPSSSYIADSLRRVGYLPLKVKKFIQTIDCDQYDIIPKLVNGIGIIPSYVPLIVESNEMEPTKYYSLSAAARGCGILKQTIVYAYRNRYTRIARRKGGSKVFRIEFLD